MATVLGAGLIGVSAAQARELRYAMGFPPGPDLGVAGKKYAERVEELTDGELSVKVYALSLLNFVETPLGVSDGMADIGYVLTPLLSTAVSKHEPGCGILHAAAPAG